ncbi:MAG: AraC family transcriptional regulator ligand-binding domain-containing protein [Moraxellaceae bacterium]|nr:AraC family transcriptional regulator ligand-binding domain-containing protein [Moraxellaceae bacterium]MDP1775258.1 AraC family transcriptional regulator ligand-binding domain-containing protein [Moraxellaceae bacterium]
MEAPDKILFEPIIPMSYFQLMAEIMSERDIKIETLLENSGILINQTLQSDARMSAVQWGLIVANAIKASGEWGLGYEYGLRMRLSVHGFLGFAVMSSLTLDEALDTVIRYFQLRQRNLILRRSTDASTCVIEISQQHPQSMGHPINSVRAFMFEALIVGLAKGIASMLQLDSFPEDVEISFDWSEPNYYSAYRKRLPPIKFNQPTNFLKFPKSFLSLRPLMADALASQQAIERCEQELELVGDAKVSVSNQVKKTLLKITIGYPTQEQMAAHLSMSSRTLARKLKAEGCSYIELLMEARKQVACSLLEHSNIELQQIANRLGYVNPANFTRAFHHWTGELPSQYRLRKREPTKNPS